VEFTFLSGRRSWEVKVLNGEIMSQKVTNQYP
jgi:hypothetical protein